MPELLHIVERGDMPSVRLARDAGGTLAPATGQPLRLWRALRRHRGRVVCWGDAATAAVLRLGLREPGRAVQVAPPGGSRVVADLGRLVCFTRADLERSILAGCPTRAAVVATPTTRPLRRRGVGGEVSHAFRVRVDAHPTHDAGHRVAVLAATILTLAGDPVDLCCPGRGPLSDALLHFSHQVGGPGVLRPGDDGPVDAYFSAATRRVHPLDRANAHAGGVPVVTVAGAFHDEHGGPALVAPTTKGRDTAKTLRRLMRDAALRDRLAGEGEAFAAATTVVRDVLLEG